MTACPTPDAQQPLPALVGVALDSEAERRVAVEPRRLGVEPAHCVVFEDAPLGIEAARRAGMRAVALTTTLPAEAFAGFDNLIAIAKDFTALEAAMPAHPDLDFR